MPRPKKYANTTGRSGVTSTKDGRGSIQVRFKDGSKYLYTNASAGRSRVRRMRELSERGSGLNGYINRRVKKGYASKES